MLIPHSERRTFSLQLSVFTLLFLAILFAVILSGFFILSTHFTATNERMAKVTRSLTESELSLETVGDEIIALQAAMEEFRTSVENLLHLLSSQNVIATVMAVSGSSDGDLSAFINQSRVAETMGPDVSELRQLRASIDGAMTPLADLNNTVTAQLELLVDIPTLWPVRGGGGWVTFEFGPQRHPFTNAFYIHRGIDIGMRQGAEIVATANGTVQAVGFERYNLGNVVELQHKYGFVTRYGHLDRVLVHEGQTVQRGDLIGLMGSTGLSTGPHVHYEVIIGDQYRNPREFLRVSALAALSSGSVSR